MMVAKLHFEAAPPLTSIQDGGRPGYMRFGVPASGPIDRLAFAAANFAVGNPPDAALVEVSAGGAVLRCADRSVGFALCGGDFTAELDAMPLGSWVAGVLDPGMQLRIRPGRHSNWACLAFAGEVRAAGWLGSRSTHALSGLGGGMLSPGSTLCIENPRIVERTGGLLMAALPPIETVRIVLGPQERFFDTESLLRLTQEPFVASAAFDRMGRRLEGPKLPPLSLDMPSEPAVRGVLQVDGAGTTTLLLADHQTTGGYPKIAAIVDTDIDRVAQLPIGAKFRFKPVSQDEAIAIVRAPVPNDVQRPIADPFELDLRLRSLNLIDGWVDANEYRMAK